MRRSSIPHYELVQCCQSGDATAQCRIVALYKPAMFKIALSIMKNRLEAEDVVQEAFMRAFVHIRHFKGESTFGAWLKRIVINTAINASKKRRPEITLAYDMPSPPQENSSPIDERSRERILKAIHEAINTLPEGYKQVFSLYQFEGYDHSEISNILGISESTSKSQYCRAKKRIRQWVTQSLPQVAY